MAFTNKNLPDTLENYAQILPGAGNVKVRAVLRFAARRIIELEKEVAALRATQAATSANQPTYIVRRIIHK